MEDEPRKKIIVNDIRPKKLIPRGEYVYTKNPMKFHLIGLGSCIGLFLFDLKLQNFVIGHCVFPEQSYVLDKNAYTSHSKCNALFIDSGIEAMIDKMILCGSEIKSIKCKLLGGGNLWGDAMNIGSKNLTLAKKILHSRKIKIIAEETGISKSLAVLEFQNDGMMLIRKGAEKYYL